MNKRQREVIASTLDDEKAVLQALEKNYTTALADIKRNIKELQANPLTQSKAYQLEFQKQLQKQLSGIVDNLQGKNFTSIADYLNTCYNQGFLGTMYDLQGQGVPLVLPIDQKQVLKAVQKTGDNIKLANKLGISTNKLKKDVLAELQRGLATQLSYTDIARNISGRGSADMNRSMRIARTEGHRVQNEAKIDSLYGAKKKGADVVKQWDSTLDSSTRDTHVELDGQIRELDENFTCSGGSAPYPGGFGDPAEDCNCRCCLLQRARWAVKDETSYQKWNNETGGFIECSGYADFKEKYLKAVDALQNTPNSNIMKLSKPNNLEQHKKFDSKKNLADVDKMSKDWEDSLTPKESNSISNYTTGDYEDINGFLRGKKSEISKTMRADIESIQKSLTTYEIPESIVVHRGVSVEALASVLDEKTINQISKSFVTDLKTAKSLNKTLADTVYTDKGFMSTSWDENASFKGKFQFDITIPKGYKNGAFIHNMSAYKSECEFLLNTGTSLLIQGVECKGKKYIIKAIAL